MHRSPFLLVQIMHLIDERNKIRFLWRSNPQLCNYPFIYSYIAQSLLIFPPCPGGVVWVKARRSQGCVVCVRGQVPPSPPGYQGVAEKGVAPAREGYRLYPHPHSKQFKHCQYPHSKFQSFKTRGREKRGYPLKLQVPYLEIINNRLYWPWRLGTRHEQIMFHFPFPWPRVAGAPRRVQTDKEARVWQRNRRRRLEEPRSQTLASRTQSHSEGIFPAGRNTSCLAEPEAAASPGVHRERRQAAVCGIRASRCWLSVDDMKTLKTP